MMARSSVYKVLALAILAPWLYDRYLAFAPLISNRPGKLKETYNIKSHELKFEKRIRNCEDVVLDEELGVAIISCDPGRDWWNTVMGTFATSKGWQNGGLYLYDYSTPELLDDQALQPLTLKNFKNAENFHPLGIELEPSTSTLYVINHAREASVIEVFRLSPKTASATHVKTLQHKLIHAPNSIHSLGDGKLFVTNDHYFHARLSPLLSKIETFAGLPIGSIVYIDTTNPSSAKTVAHLPFANGVTMLNSTTLVVASSSKAAVYFYSVAEGYDLVSKGYVRVPVSVDNISVDSEGKLLMAGHPYALSLMKVSKGRANCVVESKNEDERRACECQAPSWVGEWSEEGGLKVLYKGHAICSSSMAVRDVRRRVGMISGLYDRGLMVFRE